MPECQLLVHLSLDRSNINKVKEYASIKADFDGIIKDLSQNSVKTKRILVYCQSLNTCSSLYAYFVHAR